MKIGYHTAGLLLHDLPAAILHLKQLGYGVIALRPRKGAFDPESEVFHRQLEWIAEAIAETEMRVVLDLDAPYFHDPWKFDGPSLASPRTKESSAALRWISQWIELAAGFADLITFCSGPATTENAHKLSPEIALEHLAEQLHQLLQQSADRKVSLALRPRSGDAIASVAQFERLQQWLARDVSLGLAADIGEMLVGGELPVGDRLVRNLEHLRCVYLCQRQADHHADVPVGHGEVALTRIVSTLKQQDYDGATIVRVEGHSELGLQPAVEAIEIFADAGVR